MDAILQLGLPLNAYTLTRNRRFQVNKILAGLTLSLALITTGCNDFERNTFNTLSASNAVLKEAQADYEARKIPKTACAKAIIESGKSAQTVAVNGLLDYEKSKTSSAQAIVAAELASLAPLVLQVQTLISNPSIACGGSK
jgi:hypothetical protein